MKKISLYFLIFFCTLQNAYTQVNTNRSIASAGIKSIIIDTDEVFHIKISTTETNLIKIKTHSEGEYYNQIAINYERVGDRLKLNSSYAENLTGGYDKLSAHKIFSMEIELEIPENLEVSVYSNIASVIGKGTFKSFSANLQQGACRLERFEGNAIINTYNGDISVTTIGASLDASTRNGTLNVLGDFNGRKTIKLRSLNGNISVLKTK